MPAAGPDEYAADQLSAIVPRFLGWAAIQQLIRDHCNGRSHPPTAAATFHQTTGWPARSFGAKGACGEAGRAMQWSG